MNNQENKAESFFLKLLEKLAEYKGVTVEELRAEIENKKSEE